MPQEYPVTCAGCGAVFNLPADYVAQWGGQMTPCTRCGAAVMIPTPAQASQPPPLQASAVLPYAGIAVAQPGDGIWRSGNVLVTTNNAVLPDRCIKCNEPVAEPQHSRRLRWMHPALALLILLGIIGIVVYVILAATIGKSGRVQFSVCPKHRQQRMLTILGAWIGLFAGIAVSIMGGMQDQFVFVPVGIIISLGFAIWGLVAGRFLVPKRIDDRFMWLSGVKRPFLETMPEAPVQLRY